METVFRQTHTLSAIHTDRYGRLKPSAILFLAQDAADKHCSALSLDWETLASRGLFWAVVRHRVQITRLPEIGETVTVETWPMPTTRSAFPRATAAYDAQGRELFRCISLWILMDNQTRAMVVPGKSGIVLKGQLQGTELPPPSSIVPKALDNFATRQVRFTDLDRNGHMNNTRYLDWIDDLLPSAFHCAHPVREFTVCYLSEAREGQAMRLNYQVADGPFLQVDGYRTEADSEKPEERIFSAQIIF